jgi:hypothetical protein
VNRIDALGSGAEMKKGLSSLQFVFEYFDPSNRLSTTELIINRILTTLHLNVLRARRRGKLRPMLCQFGANSIAKHQH